MSEQQPRCTVYTKLTNPEHTDLLEVVTHSGLSANQIIHDSIVKYIDAYNTEHGTSISPGSVIDRMTREQADKMRQARELNNLLDYGKDPDAIEALREQAGIPEEMMSKSNNGEKISQIASCQIFLTGLLSNGEMESAEIKGISQLQGYNIKTIEKALHIVATHRREGRSGYYWGLKNFAS